MQGQTDAKVGAKGIIENRNAILAQAKDQEKNPRQRALKIKTGLKAGKGHVENFYTLA